MLCAQVKTSIKKSNEIKNVDYDTLTKETNNQICALACARSAPLPSHNLLPRVQPAPSRFQCARRIKCHFVFNSSDYLFSAHFPPPERVSRHLLICARAQKPERFFPLLLLLTCIHVSLHLHHERVSHSGTFSLLARVKKLEKAMNLSLESEITFFRLVFVL